AFDALGDVALRVAAFHDNSRVVAGDLGGNLRIWSAADGKKLGEITTNPPTAAERLAVVQKDLTGKEAELAKAVAARDGAKAALAKANQELAPLQKAAGDTANIAGPAKSATDALAAKTSAIKSLTDSLAANQSAADRLAAEVSTLKAAVDRVKSVAVASK